LHTDTEPEEEPGSGESDSDCWLSDENYNRLAANFAWEEGDSKSADEWEEVDDFNWDDRDPTLDNKELEMQLCTYAVYVDDELDSDTEWLPPDLFKAAKRQKKEHRGKYDRFI
jgi:hypothetical protein